MGYYRFCNNNEKFYGLIIQRWKPNNNNIKENSTWQRHLANMSTPVQQGKVQSQLHGVSNTGISGKKANAQLDNQVGNGTLDHKTIGQTAITSKGINVTKAKAQLNNQVVNGPLGHKTVKQK